MTDINYYKVLIGEADIGEPYKVSTYKFKTLDEAKSFARNTIIKISDNYERNYVEIYDEDGDLIEELTKN